MRIHPPVLAASVLLSALATARAQTDLVDQLLARYTRPKAAAGPEGIHLVVLARMEEQESTESRYFRYRPGKGWAAADTFDGHKAVAFYQGGLYVFRRDNYSVYTASDWRTAHWPLPWPPAAACTVGRELWVFGVRSVADKHRLRAARFTGDATGTEAPAALSPCVDLPRHGYDLCAVSQGSVARVFWHHRGATERANDVWQASFDGERWGQPQRVPVPQRHSDFTVAAHQGTVWLFCKARGHRISARRPLRVMRLQDDAWTRPEPVEGVRDSRLDWTFDMDAVSFRDTLFLIRACRHSVMAHPWRDGQWREPETVVRVPPWASYVVWWTVINGMACLALIPVVAWRAYRVRRQKKQAVFPDGRVLTVATWSRRTAALLLDFLFTELVWLVVAAALSLGEGDVGEQLEDLPALVALHVVVFFLYFLLGEGLSGQTVGKRLLGIVVVSRAGRRASPGRILVRNLLRPWLPLFPLAYVVGSLVLFLSPARQRVGDLLAGTLVVDAPPAPRPAEQEREG